MAEENSGIFTLAKNKVLRMEASRPENVPLDLPTYATLWDIDITKNILFYLAPQTECQAVRISNGQVPSNRSGFKFGEVAVDSPDSITFYPVASQVHQGDTSYYFPSTEVLLRADASGLYSIHPWIYSNGKTEEDKKTSRTIRLKKLLLLTSSPYCNIVVSQLDSVPSFNQIFVVGENGQIVDDYFFKSMKIYSDKSYNKLIINGYLEKYKIIEDSFCSYFKEPLHVVSSLSSYAITKKKGVSSDFILYTFDKISDCEVVKKFSYSFGVQVLNPLECPWMRLCFRGAEVTSVCFDAEKTLDILPASRVYIPTHSDAARRFDVEGNTLTHFQISYNYKFKKLTIGYVMNAEVMMVHESMYLDWPEFDNARLFVNFAKHPSCMARLTEDPAYSSYELRHSIRPHQCLFMSGCDVLISPEEKTIPWI
ncbi:unnamed protein product [Auanema sp. JU1783]|nr:unnamed protein product [Auanema sp. JU1783]